MRRRRLIAVYPEYFDENLSRGEGRRIAKKIAVKDPTLKKITYALKKLGLEYYPEPEKAYSRRWWERKGRVLVNKGEYTKEQLLVEIAKIARRLKPKESEQAKKGKGKTKGKATTKKTKAKVRKKTKLPGTGTARRK